MEDKEIESLIVEWPKIKKCKCSYVMKAMYIKGQPTIEWSFFSCITHQQLLDISIMNLLERLKMRG